MANRICIIRYCDECPHFDNEYYGYEETCKKLNRKIKRNPNTIVYEIPDDCPLTLEYSRVTSNPGQFTIYDNSQGHCALCGRMGCSGSCFK
jgi:hypothetical protein